MRKIIGKLLTCTILVLYLSTNAFALDNDKAWHGAVGYGLSSYFNSIGFNWFGQLILIETIGRIKEGIDLSSGGKWDNADIEANCIGWATYRLSFVF